MEVRSAEQQLEGRGGEGRKQEGELLMGGGVEGRCASLLVGDGHRRPSENTGHHGVGFQTPWATGVVGILSSRESVVLKN